MFKGGKKFWNIYPKVEQIEFYFLVRDSPKHVKKLAIAMISRMLEYMNVDTTPTAKVQLADMKEISDYAQAAVQYLAGEDVLVSGANTYY